VCGCHIDRKENEEYTVPVYMFLYKEDQTLYLVEEIMDTDTLMGPQTIQQCFGRNTVLYGITVCKILWLPYRHRKGKEEYIQYVHI
jgi:hypothetical protein